MEAPPAHNLVLVGFMGTGKSSLARILAQKTGCPLLDTDAEIEKQCSQPPSEIFREKGEAHFRDLETALLKSLAGKSGLIISTGGGMVIREENRRLLRELGLVVWLHAEEEVVYNRVSRNNRRPLLQTANPRATMRQLFALREPWYREVAHLQIDTGKMSHGKAVSAVLLAAGWECKPA